METRGEMATKGDTQVTWPEETTAALDQAVRAGGTVLLLGATDTGKSTLARELLSRALAAGQTAALVDADIGQSDVGPPTTIGLGIATAPVGDLSQIPAERLYFVGDTTPARHLLPAVLGTSLLVAEARARGCGLIVVDTTGMVSGRLAGALKFHKIQAVGPRVLIAVQAHSELEHFLAPFDGPGGPLLLRLPVAPGVRAKSPDARRENRQRSLAAYFADAAPLVLDREAVALWPAASPAELGGLRQRICGLLDAAGRTLAAGILLDADTYSLTVLTPLAGANPVAAVESGDIRVTPEGEELGRPSVRR